MTMVHIPRDSDKSFTVGNKEYKLSNIFAAIDAEDAADGSHRGGSAGPDGCAAAGSGGGGRAGSGGGGAAGPGAGGAAGGGATGGGAERKGPHCMMRLLGILVEDDVRPLFINSPQQATRAQLDTGAVGSRAEVWKLAAGRFRDRGHQVIRDCVGNTLVELNYIDDN